MKTPEHPQHDYGVGGLRTLKSGAVFLCFFGAHESATYEEVLGKGSTDDPPWFVTPFDHEWCRDLAISQIIVETMATSASRFPIRP